MLHHHLVGHTCRHDKREQGGQSHAHLQYPPERPLRTRKRRVREELVRLKNHIVNLLLKKIDTEISEYISVCHLPSVFLVSPVYTLFTVTSGTAARL